MRYVLAFFLSAVATLVVAQSVDPLTFRERIHDFGRVVETAGPVTYEFTFTNATPRQVKILSVTASCGCTTPGWTKDPVAPGKGGFVKVSFDPKGRPGYFNKTLTVVTDTNAGPIVLQITGTVTGGVVNNTNTFPAAIGNMKLKSKSFSMGSLYINMETALKVFEVLNDSDKPMRFGDVKSPNYITLQFNPPVLPAHEQGFIRVFYDAAARNTLGFVSDNIQITTDDSTEPVKSLTVFASLEEYYPTPTPEELKTAPQAVLAEPTIDAGQYPAGATLERSVTLYNRGKKELKIKALVGNCSCISAKADKLSLRAGDSTRIHIQFKPQTRGGTQQKAINIYTNDPRSPVQVLSVSVYVND